jgi:hypothetical protein
VIVGVVGNATQGNPRLVDLPVLYRPALQMGRAFAAPNLVIATDRETSALAAGITDDLREGGHAFAATTIFFLATGVATAVVPARRAARIDPAVALRAD